MNLLIAIFFGFFAKVFGQYSIENNTCPSVCTHPYLPVNSAQLLEGIWYLQYNIPFFFEITMKCTTLNLTIIGDYQLHFDKLEYENGTDEVRGTSGTIEYYDDGSTVFFQTELNLPFEYHTIEINDDYWILIACYECGFFDIDGAGYYASIYTRLQYPACETLEVAVTKLITCGIPRNELIVHNQGNCPFC